MTPEERRKVEELIRAIDDDDLLEAPSSNDHNRVAEENERLWAVFETLKRIGLL